MGAERLTLAAHWCGLHPAEASEPGRVLTGTAPTRRSGGDGTPEVDEFASEELGVLLDIHASLSGSWLRVDKAGTHHLGKTRPAELGSELEERFRQLLGS